MSRIVQITKSLTIGDSNNQAKHDLEEEDEYGNKKSQVVNFEVEDGIYQAGDLVEIFKRILLRMNNNDSKQEVAKSDSHVFPINDLHESSKYKSTVDWDYLLSKEDRE